MRSAVMCLLFAGACGPVYDLNKPVNFDFHPLGLGDFFDNTLASTARGAIRELGGKTDGDTMNPTIVVSRGDDRRCAHADGVANYSGSTIWICPSAASDPRRWFETIYHEVGHVLGADHSPCATGAIMAPSAECNVNRGIAPSYIQADIDEICRTAIGGVCDRDNRPTF